MLKESLPQRGAAKSIPHRKDFSRSSEGNACRNSFMLLSTLLVCVAPRSKDLGEGCPEEWFRGWGRSQPPVIVAHSLCPPAHRRGSQSRRREPRDQTTPATCVPCRHDRNGSTRLRRFTRRRCPKRLRRRSCSSRLCTSKVKDERRGLLSEAANTCCGLPVCEEAAAGSF